MSKETEKITKKDLMSVIWRWSLAGQSAWNYEKMQGLGYCFSMMPVLRKLYPDQEDMKKALNTHLQFMNTNGILLPIIFGIDIAMEESGGVESLETVSAVKTSLMGPLAGVGDTIFHVIAQVIIFSVGAYLALQGNPAGVFAFMLWAVVRQLIKQKLMVISYREGTKLVTSMSGTMNRITEAASILGLTVVGALVPSVVKANVPYVFQSGEVTLVMQEILDKIMPSFIPVLVVLLIYWLLGKEKVTSTKAIFMIIGLSVVLSALGILG